jgi:hypothetical protein
MLDELEAWNPTALDELPTWTPERFAAYAAAVDTAPEVVGVGGIDRVMYSPGAARHVLASYREILACLGQPRPPAIADGATPGPRRVAREAVALAACGRAAWGPYYVGAGESLTAQVDGVGTLRLRRDAPPTADDHDCAGTACVGRRPGPGVGRAGRRRRGRRGAGDDRVSRGRPGLGGVPGRAVSPRRRGGQGRLAARRAGLHRAALRHPRRRAWRR